MAVLSRRATDMKQVMLGMLGMALAVALVASAGTQEDKAPAPDAGGGSAASQSLKESEARSPQEHVDKKTGDGLSKKDSDTPKVNEAAPGKKPRLKYRDESRCAC